MIPELVMFAVVLGVILFVHVGAQRALKRTRETRETDLDARLVARQVAADKRTKSIDREAQRVLQQAKRALKDAEHVREDTRALQQQVNAALSDRRVQRLLDSQEGGG